MIRDNEACERVNSRSVEKNLFPANLVISLVYFVKLPLSTKMSNVRWSGAIWARDNMSSTSENITTDEGPTLQKKRTVYVFWCLFVFCFGWLLCDSIRGCHHHKQAFNKKKLTKKNLQRANTERTSAHTNIPHSVGKAKDTGHPYKPNPTTATTESFLNR